MTIEVRLAEGLAAMGIALDAPAQALLVAYLRLIEKWNKVHNLTAVREPAQMVVLHLLDSLSVLPHVAAQTDPHSAARVERWSWSGGGGHR